MTVPMTVPTTVPRPVPMRGVPPSIEFTLPPELEAHEPPEARGVPRDGVRLLVGHRADGHVSHHTFHDLPELLAPGDAIVVNTSATLAAAIDLRPDRDGSRCTVHFSTALAGGDWLVELRRDGERDESQPACALSLPGGATLRLLGRVAGGRLWRARLVSSDRDVPSYLSRYGRPIRYSYVSDSWPLAAYQTVFGVVPGSAEMPSAGRPFTTELVARLVTRGVAIIPVTLHTGVASPEADEAPYEEWHEVSEASARLVRAVRAGGGRVVAIGTTAVRALETAARDTGLVRASRGWTDLVVTPDQGVRVVDGLLTGFHEPRASHLSMLEAIAGRELVERCYTEALAQRYLWHEFGDVNLYV